MTEARRHHDDDWHESFENGLVRSLSRSFYDSYAKGHCSGSVAGKVTRSILRPMCFRHLLLSMSAFKLLLTGRRVQL